MSKTLRDEDLRLNIIVNGDSARKRIEELRHTTQDSKVALDALIDSQKKLEAAGKSNTTEYKTLTAEIDKHSKKLEEQKAKLGTLIRQQSLEKMTLRELQQHYKSTMAVYKNAVPGTEKWVQLRTELKQVDARMRELKASALNSGGVLKSAANGFSKFFGAITAGFASLSFAIMGAKKARTAFLEYDEALTDAQKTTKTTKKQITEISNELKKIDTRTAQNQLLDIVRVAGKLGIEGTKNLIEFTRAGDKIGVALARDLGGNAEAAIQQIGKLVDIFHLKEQYGIEQSMLKVGSAINEIGMASTAAEGFVVDFAKRAAGTAPNVDISIQSVLGLAGALDKLGQQSETSGTAYGQVITAMYKRTEVFAKIAKMSLGDFKKLMAEDMNEAFIRVLEGMGKSKKGMQSIVDALDAMKLDGQRSTQVLGVLAANTDELRRQQDIANKAFADGTSIMEEFNTKNNSATAQLEKQKKAITTQAAALGEELNPIYASSVSLTVTFLKVITVLVKYLIQSKGAIIALAAAYIGYLAVVKSENAMLAASVTWKKLQAFWSEAHRIALMRETVTMITYADATTKAKTSTLLMSAAQNLLVGNFRAAGIAAKAFFVSMGPIGWITIALGGLATAWTMVASKSSTAHKAQKLLSEHMQNAATEAAAERAELDRLKGKLEACRVGTKAYNDTKKEIINKFGQYDSTLKKETLTVETLRDKYVSLSNAIMQSARTRQYNNLKEEMQKIFDDKFKETSDKLWKKLNDQYYTEKASKYYNQIMNAFFGGQSLDAWLTTGSSKTKKLVGELITLRDEQKKIDKEARSRFGITDAPSGATPSPIPSSDSDGDTGPNPMPTNSSKEWSLDKDKTFIAARIKLKEKYRSGEIESETEFGNKLLALEIKSLEDRLNLNKESGADRLKLEDQLADKRLSQKKSENKNIEEANSIIAAAELDPIKRENKQYENSRKKFAGNAAALEALEKQHNRTIAKIHLERIDERVQRDQEQFSLNQRLLKQRHRQELADFRGNADERKQLRKEQLAEEAQLEVDHATKLAAQLKTLFDSGLFDDIQIDWNLLPEADRRKLENQIADINEIIQNLRTTVTPTGYSFAGQKEDILGFTQDDWNIFFENLKSGKLGTDDWILAITAMAEVTQTALSLYASYDKMMTSKENAEFKRYQKNQEKKKKSNQARVDAGLMTAEQASAEEERMQAEADAKQQELEIKQAKRQKAMSITEAIINTAVGVAAALRLTPPASYIMAAITGAMGAAQVAMIASTPIVGAEIGGPVVERMQDGKKFNAKQDPDKRGFITSPTVLVSENGKEYVVPSEAMDNPTLMPVLNTIEAARKQGTIGNFDFNAVYRQPVKAIGRASGGTIDGADINTTSTPSNTEGASANKLNQAIEKLIAKLDDPIESYVTVMGKNGIVKKMEEYERNRKHGKLG